MLNRMTARLRICFYLMNAKNEMPVLLYILYPYEIVRLKSPESKFGLVGCYHGDTAYGDDVLQAGAESLPENR